MIAKIYFFGSIFVAIVSFLYSMLALCGKDIILNNTYIRANEEERKKMNKKAYRLQSAIIFLLISILSLANALRFLLNLKWITYASIIILVAIIIFYFVSSKKIKNKNKDSGQ